MGDTMSRQKYTMSWNPSAKTENPIGPLVTYVLSSSAACLAEIATYPLDLVKTRQQVQQEAKKYDAVFHRHARAGLKPETAMEILRRIIQKEGVLKLWEGGSPALLRQVGFAGTRVTVYEMLRQYMGRNEDGSFDVWKAMLAGLFGGAAAQFVASPTDLIKVQMQLEGQRRLEGKKPRVKGMIHAAKRIVNKNGFTGLWAGWRPNIHYAAITNMAALGSYDVIKHTAITTFRMKDNAALQSLSSLLSSFVLAILVVPPDMVRTRMFNQPRDPVGRGLLYKNTTDCLLKVLQNEGVRSFYSGFWAFYIRLVPWTWIFWLS